ncbi:MAG TPA: signal recognition particle protein [SAR202 cluster bacterium]|jgi:signal recognition particle subunit SRP54|nr:signal recognition particle protein [SAR202 cluster bacterium]HJO59371.1 signal recognition particle protein [SAR202 cluster bacterium]|tara:strand:+ start:1579 stop:2931 length:1353 start_codon:yes stop_codon:yes gene_type:complete
MFETLTDRLTSVIKSISNKGHLTEKDIDTTLKEVRRALLEADVNFKVARSFVASIKEQVIGEEILSSITAGQHVVKVTNDELIKTLGGVSVELTKKEKHNTVLMVGLNGSGKTTTSAKLAKHLKDSGQSVGLVAADVHRPAAIEQLSVLADQIGISLYEAGTEVSAAKVSIDGYEAGKNRNFDWTIIDTAGRFQVDSELMDELEEIQKSINPTEVLLVVDAMTGQESVNVAQNFHDRIGLTGLVLTKMDGDARGGAALSITSVTGIPVKYIGVGERIDALEKFHPDRLASRILGMGDVLTLAEKAQATFDQDQMADLERKIKQSTFDLEDFLNQMQAVKKMGSMSQILEMVPGFSMMKGKVNADDLDDNHLVKAESIIYSMTPDERSKPEMIGGSRRRRIAKGSGTSPQDVNQLLNQFKQVRKMMKEMSSSGGQKKMMRMLSQKGNPFGF